MDAFIITFRTELFGGQDIAMENKASLLKDMLREGALGFAHLDFDVEVDNEV